MINDFKNPSLSLSFPANVINKLSSQQFNWLVTGGAGFIGSHLVQSLLSFNQKVTVIDNLETGFKNNIYDHPNYTFVLGDIRSEDLLKQSLLGIDYVLHQAAMVSVPISVERPLECHQVNCEATMLLMELSRLSKVKRMIFASSSAVYGDISDPIKTESRTGFCLSPYAASKRANELFAESYYRSTGFEVAGLRYFNAFGARQSPTGAYAAVVPKWITAVLKGEKVKLFGDGLQTRDFCHVDNIVVANLTAALLDSSEHLGKATNVGLGQSMSLLQLRSVMNQIFVRHGYSLSEDKVEFLPERVGDVKTSLADVTNLKDRLKLDLDMDLEKAIERTFDWYLKSQNFFD